MIEYIVDQSLVLSVIALLLIGTTKWATARLGPILVYRLYWLIPFTLGIGLMPIAVVPKSIVVSAGLTNVAMPSLSLIDIDSAVPWVTIWAVGFIGIILFISASLVHGRYILRQANRVSTYKHLAIAESQKTNSPMLVGLFRPVVVLPNLSCNRYSQDQLKFITAHEYVHAKRFDNLLNVAAASIAALFWFNPISWIALSHFRLAQEISCDYRVLESRPIEDRKPYAEAIFNSLGTATLNQKIFVHAGDKHMLLTRLTHIKTKTRNSMLLTTMVMLAALLTVGCNEVSKHTYDETNEAKIVVAINPSYPRALVDNNVEGEVILSFNVTANGATTDLSVVNVTSTDNNERSHELLAKAATTALAKSKFMPLKRQSVQRRRYSFKLPE